MDNRQDRIHTEAGPGAACLEKERLGLRALKDEKKCSWQHKSNKEKVPGRRSSTRKDKREQSLETAGVPVPRGEAGRVRRLQQVVEVGHVPSNSLRIFAEVRESHGRT